MTFVPSREVFCSHLRSAVVVTTSQTVAIRASIVLLLNPQAGGHLMVAMVTG